MPTTNPEESRNADPEKAREDYINDKIKEIEEKKLSAKEQAEAFFKAGEDAEKKAESEEKSGILQFAPYPELNKKIAERFYKIALEKGHPLAQKALYKCYEYEYNIYKSRKSCNNEISCGWALLMIGWMLSDGRLRMGADGPEVNIDNSKPNRKAAFKHFLDGEAILQDINEKAGDKIYKELPKELVKYQDIIANIYNSGELYGTKGLTDINIEEANKYAARSCQNTAKYKRLNNAVLAAAPPEPNTQNPTPASSRPEPPAPSPVTIEAPAVKPSDVVKPEKISDSGVAAKPMTPAYSKAQSETNCVAKELEKEMEKNLKEVLEEINQKIPGLLQHLKGEKIAPLRKSLGTFFAKVIEDLLNGRSFGADTESEALKNGLINEVQKKTLSNLIKEYALNNKFLSALIDFSIEVNTQDMGKFAWVGSLLITNGDFTTSTYIGFRNTLQNKMHNSKRMVAK